MNKECDFCGLEFVPKRTDAKFCSENCRQKAYLRRRQEETEQLNEQIRELRTRQTTDIDEAVNFGDKDISKEGIQINDSEDTHNRDVKSFSRINDEVGPQPSQELQRISEMTNKRQTTDNVPRDKPDPHERIEVEIKGKAIKMPKSMIEFFGKDFFDGMEMNDSDEDPLQDSWSYSEKERAGRISSQLRKWIKALIRFKKRTTLKEVKFLVQEINQAMNSFDFKYLPKGYSYKSFIEVEFYPRVKKLLVTMEANRQKRVSVEIDDKFGARLMDILCKLS